MLLNKDEYLAVLKSVKSQIRKAQYQALINANKEMIILYWNIGNTINERSAWGNKFIDNLSRDIKLEFPDVTGFSVRNLKYMAKFAATWTKAAIVQRSLHNLPWRHNIVLMEKTKKNTEREWYAARAIENTWSRDMLVHQIESGLYERQASVKKIANFQKRLPNPQGELALQTMKDPYIFDFITTRENMMERDIENEKDNIIAEYALRDMTKPIGVSEYKILKRLPKELKKELPSIEDIKKRIL